MKKLSILTALMMVGFTISAQKEVESKIDTTRIKMGNSTIIILKNMTDDKPYDIDFNDEENPKSKKQKENWDLYMDWGVSGYLTPNFELSLPTTQNLMELDYGHSSTIGFTTVYRDIKLIGNRVYLSPGYGIAWNSYSFKNSINISTSNDHTEFTEDISVQYDKYKLKATYLQVPLMLGFKMGDLNKRLDLQVGLIGSFKIGSMVKEKYISEQVKYKNKIRDGYNLNPFKFDGVARFRVKNVGLHARYSFTTLFEKNKAAELYPFSFGITLWQSSLD